MPCWRPLGFGAVGFADDYLKITRRNHHGLIPRYKMGGQILVGLGVGLSLMALAHYNLYSTRLIFPFFKGLIPDLGWLYVPFAVLVLVSVTNAVNLTDGLDGLAISTFAIVAAAFTALAYVTGHRILADYLLLVRFAPAGELTIFCGALVGASLGFLWYNCYPAEIFMGDVGSLALGGALARSRFSSSRNCCSSSSAACSCSRRSRSSCRWPRSSSRASGCSAWPRFTTISSSSAGANRR